MKLNKVEFSMVVCDFCIFGTFAVAIYLIIGIVTELMGFPLLP